MVNQSPANSLSAGAALHELTFLGSSYNFLVYVYRGSPVRTINSNTATGPLLRVNQSPATIYHMSTACRNGVAPPDPVIGPPDSLSAGTALHTHARVVLQHDVAVLVEVEEGE
jgi:hypothetical protein